MFLTKFIGDRVFSSISVWTFLVDRWNYMPPILVPSSAKRIATQILVIAKVHEKKIILRGFVCDIIRPSKELPVQS